MEGSFNCIDCRQMHAWHIELGDIGREWRWIKERIFVDRTQNFYCLRISREVLVLQFSFMWESIRSCVSFI